MGKPTRATQGKRNRERDQRERKQEKLDMKAFRKQNKAEREVVFDKNGNAIDPDLVGIFPGPQPLKEE